MPDYTIEVTYHLPVYRHRTYSADTPAEACRRAIEDDDGSGEKFDYETAGETYVSGIWRGADAAYSGSAVPVPSHFGETIERKARHFEILLGILKIIVADAQASRATSADWIAKACWAIARGEAILAGARDPDEPADMPAPCHVLAALHEERVRDQIAAILETDPDFAGVSLDAVADNDIHTASLAVARTTDLAEEIGGAEFRAALAALGAVRSRIRNS